MHIRNVLCPWIHNTLDLDLLYCRHKWSDFINYCIVDFSPFTWPFRSGPPVSFSGRPDQIVHLHLCDLNRGQNCHDCARDSKTRDAFGVPLRRKGITITVRFRYDWSVIYCSKLTSRSGCYWEVIASQRRPTFCCNSNRLGVNGRASLAHLPQIWLKKTNGRGSMLLWPPGRWIGSEVVGCTMATYWVQRALSMSALHEQRTWTCHRPALQSGGLADRSLTDQKGRRLFERGFTVWAKKNNNIERLVMAHQTIF